MIWALYWYACAAYALWEYAGDEDPARLAHAIIFVVLGTGQRIVRAIEKGKTEVS